ncbi:MAG: chromosome segregation protein SMC [Deltaproteobacteria bacterium]|nr:chromosome segregation protein SMC [Deltaproteobacteria bacterium]MBW2626035.1 chromosome segregation protein SMC [Deltaproteobacteria bacterium]MBW2684393.1 chromosome segregation protein SMC [Deltaproteobacteria bacterium]
MKIKKLQIVGFKSFVDQTTVHFDHDITCVVGPNGCGKSNLVDAIKWCMGEQSPSRLRGKHMEDVIFSGAEGRGPHGFSEVTLTFDNTDGLAPPEYSDYAEIQVTRRLDRQGNSDYRINRTPVRLLDITNLFLGTGVGKRAYSIIEQGRIGYIVTSKPEDRRSMIEEAAGISKFKLSKRTAERKMDQTRQNLLRVTDIIGELERSLASLKRQAQKAERYKRYKTEMRDLDLWVASHRFLELRGQMGSVSVSLSKANEDVQSSRRTLIAKEASVEADRVSLQQMGSEVERGQGRAYELDNLVRQLEGLIRQQQDRQTALVERKELATRELRQLEGQRDGLQQEVSSVRLSLSELESLETEAGQLLSEVEAELQARKNTAEEAEVALQNARARLAEGHARVAGAEAVLNGYDARRKDIRGRLERLQEELQTLATREVEFTQQGGELEARMVGLRSGKSATAERQTEIETSLSTGKDALHRADGEVDGLREKLAVTRSRLRSLNEIHERFEGVGAGAQAVMTGYANASGDTGRSGLVGLVADRLECPAEHTRALGAALGGSLEYLLVYDTDAALRAADYLAREEKGRATFLPRSPRGAPRIVPQFPAGMGIVGPLLTLVRYSHADEAWVRHLLFDVLVVDTLQTAARLHRQGFQGKLVTLDGQALLADGAVVGGAKDESATHLLRLKREIRELEEAAASEGAELDGATANQGRLRANIAERQAAIDSARVQAHDAELEILGAERDLRVVEMEIRRIEERRREIANAETEGRAALSEVDVDESNTRRQLTDAQRDVADAEEASQVAESVLSERRRVVDEQAAKVTEVKVGATQSRERADRERSLLGQLDRSISELDAREARLRDDVAIADRDQGQAAGRILLHRGRLSETAHDAGVAREGLSSQRARFDEAQTQLGESEASLKKLRSTIDEQSTELNELTLRERELTLSLEHLDEQVLDKHRVELAYVIGDHHARPVPDAEVTARAEELQRLIDRMGEINLTAIEEYEENAGRYEYLTSQRRDLEDALTKLEKAIRQMNRESRALFREAFTAINERFKRIFPLLFRGGKAELKLTEPQDMLETGVDIIAQPPGKRLGSLELMSGGEKALTAVAMIFAIFQYKPSPFCLLDEVDAPLDEANIGRFAEVIQQMTDRSQFIIITHSKRTMEFADVLYGVTMEQPGVSKLVSVELRGKKRPIADAAE